MTSDRIEREIEFSLSQQGTSTRLRLVESGMDAIAISDDAKKVYFSDHTSGWDQIIERLCTYGAEPGSVVTRS